MTGTVSEAEGAARDTEAQLETQHPIVFFDGVCVFCNRSVQFLIKRDRRGILRFAPLQGSTFRQFESQIESSDINTPDLSTMVLHDERGLHTRSTAALRSMVHVGGMWGVVGRIALLVPRPLRDFFYRGFARKRYQWFGKLDACSVPTPEERERFLD
jgi:predicted DCC family thiol-disulfide oxidoreductase YuxK